MFNFCLIHYTLTMSGNVGPRSSFPSRFLADYVFLAPFLDKFKCGRGPSISLTCDLPIRYHTLTYRQKGIKACPLATQKKVLMDHRSSRLPRYHWCGWITWTWMTQVSVPVDVLIRSTDGDPSRFVLPNVQSSSSNVPLTQGLVPRTLHIWTHPTI
ncbi:hypothetical protein L210DRAFT_67199, partial [Boletus edulis BED1]